MAHATQTRWDPDQYQRHSGHRNRPLLELLARIPDPATPAPRVADLGCGPGGPSELLAQRWPAARITGLDNSEAMLERARAHEGPTAGGGFLRFAHADLSTWRPDPAEPLDVIVSNAAFQWVPGHVERLADWVAGLVPGGVLAFQVPGNFGAPSHALMRQLAAAPRWRDRLAGVLRTADPVLSAEGYFRALADLGCEVDAWETTYLHVLKGEDPVLDWVKGTGLRPVLTALEDDPEARDAFVAEYREALREAYPSGPHGTLFPFRRIFAGAPPPAWAAGPPPGAAPGRGPRGPGRRAPTERRRWAKRVNGGNRIHPEALSRALKNRATRRFRKDKPVLKKTLASAAVMASAIGVAGLAASPAMAVDGNDDTTATINGNHSPKLYGNTTTGGYMSPNLALVNGSLNDVCVPLTNTDVAVPILQIVNIQDILNSKPTQNCSENSTQVDGDDPLSHLLENIPILSENGSDNGSDNVLLRGGHK